MIYLASASPRRRRLLKSVGWSYRILRPDYHEPNIPGLSAARLTMRHAKEKALSVAGRVQHGVVLSADTVVWSGGKILGKPSSAAHAVTMLASLCGRWHTVFTSVSLLWMREGRVMKAKHFTEKTGVKLRAMTRAEIRSYHKKINPLDKAGAYAIQSAHHGIVEEIRGSYTNAVGLPMEKLQKMRRVLR